MKYYSKEHEKALKLKRQMDTLTKDHLKMIENQDKKERTKTYGINKRINDQIFNQQMKSYEQKEDELFRTYSLHMQKNLGAVKKQADVNKFKEGFLDKKYINTMFKARERQLAKEKRSQNATKRKSKK